MFEVFYFSCVLGVGFYGSIFHYNNFVFVLQLY